MLRFAAEPDQMSDMLRKENAVFVPKGRGEGHGEFVGIPLGTTMLRCMVGDVAWSVSATTMANSISLVLPLYSEGVVSYNGTTIDPRSVALYGAAVDHCSEQQGATTSIYVPFDLDQVVGAIGMLAPDIDPTRVREITFSLMRTEHALELRRILSLVLQDAQRSPGLLSEYGMLQAIERSLLTQLALGMAASTNISGSGLPSPCGTERAALVRSVEQYLRAHVHEPVYMMELCAATGATERGLQAAFRELTGLRPMEYLRLRRLQLVRRQLRAPGNTGLSVKRAALDHGFWELGRFAQQYRALFGEMPSATLRKATHAR